jgi:hypothetical protein
MRTITNLKNTFGRVRTCSLILAGGVAAFAFALPSYGDSLNYSFTGTAGATGSATDTLTSDGVSVSATGYSATDTTEQLYIRNDDDHGLGLISTALNHEISGGGFIQVNLSQLWAQHPTSVILNLSSVDPGENYNIWGSNAPGAVAGTLLMSHVTASDISLLGLSGYNYITIDAPEGSVLLNSIDAVDGSGSGTSSVPEPGMLTLLALGLACAGFVAHRSGSNGPTQA